MRALLLGVMLGLVAPAAQAQLFSGTVTGVVTAADPRTDPYGAAGYPDGSNGGAARLTNRFEQDPIALRNALVVVCVRLAYAPCTPLWTRTDATGRYTVPWSGMAPPTSIRTRVYAQQPDIAIGAVVASAWPPAATFRVTTAGISDVIIGERTENTNLTGNRTINVLVDPIEPTAAFLTAREVYSMLGSQSIPPGGSILDDMGGVDIFVNDLGVPGGGGIAPTDSEVLLIPNTATFNPFTLAHELGHIVAWRSLDLGGPPYEFTAYAACGASGDYPWADFTLECEKPAFWEGFAHLVGGFWMWNPEVMPADPGDCGTSGHGIPRGGNGINCTSLESALQRPGFVGGANACGVGAPSRLR